MGGRQYRGWTTDRYALVSLVNAQRANNYILTMVNRDPKRPRPPVPEPFPTPQSDERKHKKLKPGSFAAVAAKMLADQRKKKEQAHGP